MYRAPGKLRILVSDDQDFDRRIACADLRGDHDVVEAFSLASTLAALDQAKRQGRPFDVVLQDLDLGDSRGRHTFDAVKSAAEGTPIVVYTGCADDVVRLGIMRDGGADDFLVKKPGTEPAHIRRALEFAALRRSATRDTKVISDAARDEADQLDTLADEQPGEGSMMRALANSRRDNAVILDRLDRIEQRQTQTESVTTTNRNDIVRLASTFSDLPLKEKGKVYIGGVSLGAIVSVIIEVLRVFL